MPVSAIKGWEVHIDLDLSNQAQSQMGSGGFAVYYLRNREYEMSGVYGYTNKFDGAAVIVSSLIKQKVQNEKGV